MPTPLHIHLHLKAPRERLEENSSIDYLEREEEEESKRETMSTQKARSLQPRVELHPKVLAVVGHDPHVPRLEPHH